MDGAPRVGVLSARVLVDEAGETDATCRLMARSPLDATSLPGPLGKRSRHARRGLRARGRNRRVCRYRYASEHQHTAGSRWRIGMTSRMSMRGDTMPRAAVFLDKDGTLLADVPYNVDPLLMRLAPGAHEALLTTCMKFRWISSRPPECSVPRARSGSS